MTIDYLQDFFEIFNFSEESKITLTENFLSIIKNPDAKLIFDNILYSYNENMNCDFNAVITQADEMARIANIHPYTANALVVIALTKISKKYYQQFSIPEEVWQETMQDIKYKMVECKLIYDIWGTFVPSWYQGFFNLNIFAFGRLQFELIKFGHDYEYQGIKLSPTDYVLNVHIPRTGARLEKEQVDSSYKQAIKFFSKVLQKEVAAFVCTSWLLAPQTIKLLKVDSNIYKFTADYNIIESEDYLDYSQIWRLYDKNYNGNFDDLPKDTALRKNYIEHFKKGGKFGYGYGVYLADIVEK